jgi:hypothetical protein
MEGAFHLEGRHHAGHDTTAAATVWGDLVG